MGKRASVASHVGHLLAHVQHGMDRMIIWGFSELRRAGKDSSREKNYTPPKRGILPRLSRFARGTFRFLGEAGEGYYEKYEDLKKG